MKTKNLFRVAAVMLTVLGPLGPVTLPALDVSEYGVLKGKQYTQDAASTPPDGEWSLYWLSAYARMTTADSVTDAMVLPPSAEDPLQLYVLDDPLVLEVNLPGGFNITDMNANFPNGAYALALTTANDGTKNLGLSISGDAYPNTPTFLNFAALGAVNPSAAFAVSWSPFAGGTTNDYIQVRVVDSDDNVVFSTPVAGAVGALDGTAASVGIPANTLLPESYYTARLLFVKVTTRNTTGYPGITGLGGYYKYTDASLTTTAGGGADTTPPQLVASVPTHGAVNVSVSSPVVFTFNEAMAEAQSIAWSANVNAAGFLYNWSGDGRTLTCTYLGSLPAAATITWTLNPSAQPLNFEDVAGNPLPANLYAGSFSTSTNGPCGPGDDDGRGSGGINKQLTYVQTSAASPTPDSTSPATFLSSAVSPTNNLITSAKLQVPGGPLLTLTNFLGLGRSYLTVEEYASQTALDTARPNATYNLQLTRTTGGPVSADISLAGTWPNTPQIMNYEAAQAINPSADFVLQWNGFTGASGSDSVGVTLVNPTNFWYWSAPDPCVPRPLANTATSVTIPAGTLQPGTTYECTLSYTRFPYSSTNAIVDMQLLTMLQKSLEFTIKTTGGSGSRARFVGWRMVSAGSIELQLQGTVGKSYWIESSATLTGGWLPMIQQTIPSGGVATFQMAVGSSPRFFRARE